MEYIWYTLSIKKSLFNVCMLDISCCVLYHLLFILIHTTLITQVFLDYYILIWLIIFYIKRLSTFISHSPEEAARLRRYAWGVLWDWAPSKLVWLYFFILFLPPLIFCACHPPVPLFFLQCTAIVCHIIMVQIFPLFLGLCCWINLVTLLWIIWWFI